MGPHDHHRMTRSAIVRVLLLVAGAAACAGAPRFALPPVPGVAAPDAVSIWTEATSACRGVSTLSSELRLSGRIGDGRSIRPSTVLVGVTDAGQIRLEVPAPFGRPVFTLAGTEDRATIVTRDNRALTAATRDIVEALTGLSLGPRALLDVLSGCGAAGDTAADGMRFGDVVSVTVDGRRVYVRPVDAGYRVAAAELPGLMVDYAGTSSGWPSRVRVTSSGAGATGLDLVVTQQQVEINRTFRDADFVVLAPAGAAPLTLDDLRQGRP